MVTRQPIVSILGHVDHGKTTLLDRIRGTTVAAGEAGGITQHIGATEVPLASIEETCEPLMGDREFTLPGLLFIDTPGHRAFTTLRARGGALADIGVVVVDVQEGLMPQTKESLSILKRNGTPFIVAANKIDRIHGWDPNPDTPFVQSFPEQPQRAQDRLQEALYDVIGDLYDEGYPADRYDQISDFRETVAIVPMSAETGEGIADLLLVLTGLAQRFLEQEGGLEADPEGPGRATVLEVKEEKGFGATVDVILYDGKLTEGQTIVVGTTDKPRETTIRALLRPKALDEIRDPSERFESVDEVKAATGLKVSAPDLDDVVPGAPLYGATPETVDEVVEQIESELEPDIQLDEHEGVFIKADTLGSLEALASEMAEAEIPIRMARVGDISPRDVIEAATLDQEEHKCILGFGVDVLSEAREELKEDDDVEIITDDVVYNLIDEYEEYLERLKLERQEKARAQIAFPGKFKFLPDHSFRMRKPAILGVRVLKGRVRQGQRVLREDGRVVGEIQSIRREDNPITEAEQGEEVAIAVDDVQIGRQMDEGEIYYVDIPEGDFQKLSDFDLTVDEQETMQEVAEIKREKHEPYWGM